MDPNIEFSGIEVKHDDHQELDMLYYLTGNLIGKAHFFRRELDKMMLPYEARKELQSAGYDAGIIANINVLEEHRGKGLAADMWLQAELKRLEVWNDLTLCKTIDTAVQIDVWGHTQFTGWTTRHFPYVIDGIKDAGYKPEILYQNTEQMPWFVWKT